MKAFALAAFVLAIAPAIPAHLLAQNTPAAPTGEQLFNSKCLHCHGPAQWGTRALAKRVPAGQAELLQRQSIPPALVKLAVRRGIGSMPQFTPTDLTDAELDRLAAWLEHGR